MADLYAAARRGDPWLIALIAGTLLAVLVAAITVSAAIRPIPADRPTPAPQPQPAPTAPLEA